MGKIEEVYERLLRKIDEVWERNSELKRRIDNLTYRVWKIERREDG